MPDEPLDLLTLTDETIEALYAERIAPILRGGEGDREAAMKTYVFRAVLGGAGALAVAAVVYSLWGDAWDALIFGGIAFAAAHWWAYRPLQEVATAMKTGSLNAIADAIGCTFNLGSFEPEALPRFNELQLLPSCDRSSYQDCFTGAHHGCRFAFYEGHLEVRRRSKNSSTWHTVFRGQLIRIAFPKKFQGTTVIRRDAGMFNMLQRWTTSLQRVGLVDSKLEKAFEVYSNDQVEARYLIHPVFM